MVIDPKHWVCHTYGARAVRCHGAPRATIHSAIKLTCADTQCHQAGNKRCHSHKAFGHVSLSSDLPSFKQWGGEHMQVNTLSTITDAICCYCRDSNVRWPEFLICDFEKICRISKKIQHPLTESMQCAVHIKAACSTVQDDAHTTVCAYGIPLYDFQTWHSNNP